MSRLRVLKGGCVIGVLVTLFANVPGGHGAKDPSDVSKEKSGSPVQAVSPSAFTTIVSGGPLTKIYVGDQNGFQVEHSSFPGIGQFYHWGWNQPAHMGVFLRDHSTNTFYGSPSTEVIMTPWTPVSLSAVTGSGTPGSPYSVTVVSDAGTCLRMTMTVTYVSTEDFFRHRFTITNLCGQSRCFDLYLGSDIYLANSDVGLPVKVGSSVGGQNCPGQDYTVLHIPVSPATSDHYFAGFFADVWTGIQSGAPLSDLIETTTCPGVDNGAALQWSDRCLAPGASLTIDAATSLGQIPAIAMGCDRTCDIFAGQFPVFYETRAGNRDDFTTFDGPEVAAPDGPLQAYLSTCGASPLICPPGLVGPMFDCPAIDQCFGHTFYQTWDTSRCIIDASLCFKVAAIGAGSTNDRLRLLEDGVEIWSVDMNLIRSLQTAGADPTWGGESADTMEYCINLADLPLGGVGPNDILIWLQDADLDVIFEMNTMVDYVQLDVTVCCTGCVADGDIDGDGSVWSVADLIALTRFVEGVGTAPIPLCRADLNADGMIDQADMDFFDCVFTHGVGFCLETYPVPTPCIQDTIRGCCIENDSCFIRSPSNCASRGGLYLGDGAVECCWCPHQGDLNGDGFVDAVDLAIMIDIVFFGAPDVQDPCCPTTRGDFNGDGFVDASDLAFLIDFVFFGSSGPTDPCGP